MSAESKERRAHHRVQLKARVTLQFDDENIITDTDLRDLSLDGVSLHHTRELHLGSVCGFEITITGPTSTLTFSGQGRIIRQDKHGTAVKFIELEMDSYIHLKNIVLMNRTPKAF